MTSSTAETTGQLKSSSAEVFVLGVSVLSIVNIGLLVLPFRGSVHEVVYIIDGLVCAVLLTDFFLRFHRGGRPYVIHEGGWIDFLGSLPAPGLRVLRLVRIFKASHSMRGEGWRGLVHDFTENLAEGALLVIVFFVILVLEFGSIFELVAEAGGTHANITTGGDALWWNIVTITTVGYGDLYPTTSWGRAVGVVVLCTGVALFGTITGYIVNSFLGQRRQSGLSPSDPRSTVLADAQRLLDQQEETIAALRQRLEQLSAS